MPVLLNRMRGIIMNMYKSNYDKSGFSGNFEDGSCEIFSYQGNQVRLLTVFKNGKESVAVVEDTRGEQFEVFKNQLYKV